VHELAVYMQGDDEIPLAELKYPKEDCCDCHEHGTFDQIVEMTAELEETVGPTPRLLTTGSWSVGCATRCMRNPNTAAGHATSGSGRCRESIEAPIA